MEDQVQVTDKPAQELTEQQEVLKTFNDTLNMFIKKVSEYSGSKAQLQRLMINLAISPLNKEEFHFSYPEEKELFDIGSGVNSSKFFLMLAGLETQGKIVFTEPKEEGKSNE